MNPDDAYDSAFSETPPEKRTRSPFYEILRPRPESEVSAIITSHFVTFTYTHYYDKQSYVCLTKRIPDPPPTTCPFCLKGWAARIKGYLCGFSLAKHRNVILEMTDNCLFTNNEIREGLVSLRGRLLKLVRKGKHKNSPVTAQLLQCFDRGALTKLPAPFDLKEALKVLWEIPTQQVFDSNGNS